MLTTVPEQDAGHLYKPQVVGSLLLVAHQDGSTLREPAQRSLHYPPSRRTPLLALSVQFLLADPTNVGNVVLLVHHLPDRFTVVALVQTQVLGRFFASIGPLHYHRFKRSFQQLVIPHVRPGEHHCKRPSVGLDQDAPFYPVLAPIGGIRADKIPPKRALPIAPSAACHSHSTPPSSSHSSIRAAQIRSKIPISTHRWKVRCTLESSGKSLGRRVHWQPLRIRKRSRPGRLAGRRGGVRCLLADHALLGSARSSPTTGLARARWWTWASR